jgi:hypothetical protein
MTSVSVDLTGKSGETFHFGLEKDGSGNPKLSKRPKDALQPDPKKQLGAEQYGATVYKGGGPEIVVYPPPYSNKEHVQHKHKFSNGSGWTVITINCYEDPPGSNNHKSNINITEYNPDGTVKASYPPSTAAAPNKPGFSPIDPDDQIKWTKLFEGFHRKFTNEDGTMKISYYPPEKRGLTLAVAKRRRNSTLAVAKRRRNSTLAKG